MSFPRCRRVSALSRIVATPRPLDRCLVTARTRAQSQSHRGPGYRQQTGLTIPTYSYKLSWWSTEMKISEASPCSSIFSINTINSVLDLLHTYLPIVQLFNLCLTHIQYCKSHHWSSDHHFCFVKLLTVFKASGIFNLKRFSKYKTLPIMYIEI